MRVLGLDPGIERTGFAILESDRGEVFSLLECGRILTNRRAPFSNRLMLIAEDVRKLIREFRPDAAALEQIFFSKNVKTAINVSHARGVLLELLEENGIPVQEFNPGSIKLAITGSGRADKIQMRKMIHLLLKRDIPHDDALDAVACGLCFLQQICVSPPVSASSVR